MLTIILSVCFTVGWLCVAERTIILQSHILYSMSLVEMIVDCYKSCGDLFASFKESFYLKKGEREEVVEKKRKDEN